ncbi:carboxyl transferase domain-containing protein [Streptomyces sp. NPDC001404]|uniref:ATP-binding protein n=1 Tax=Streptomyces sp. NPDC001404 TaxID=3364571 RepID=UPI0036B94A1E
MNHQKETWPVFRRIAIVNRGEAAMRLIHAVRDLSAQTGKVTETVALYTDADRGAAFVREADRSVCLGAAADRPYLDLAVLERALAESGADAAWPGWGFVAEDPAFAELCEKAGVTFVGPSAEAMRKLGDKIGAKLIAEKAGVPVAPWSRGPVATLEEAHRAAERIGYPLMLKATAGGGGRGIRVITSPADLTEALQRTRSEALRAFGNGTVFLERLVTGARHVEVQVIADGRGTAWALGVRDCSVQRRNQKVIEESASPLLSAEQVTDLKASAERLVLSVGYRGAATVEFLYHPDDKQFAFLEVNTRLQVEHPVTELTTGTDLVRMQLHVASGGRLSGERPAEAGHAVEARLNAEDPDRDFAPAPGRIARLVLPAGPGIRVDTGVREGDTIPADFDSMIAKVIAYGRDRDEALARLRRAMTGTSVVIEGGATNKSFVLDLLDQPEVTDGNGEGGWADTGWIDRVRAQGRLAAREHSGVALVAAAVRAYEDEEAAGRQALLAAARGGRPHVRHDPGQAVDYKLRDVSYRVRVARRGPDRFRVGIAAGGDIAVADAVLERFDGYSGAITVNGQRFRLTASLHGPVHLVEVDGVAHGVSRAEGGVVRSPAPALVIATPVAAGDEVAEGDPVLVLESMKMETVLRAPFRALVRECPVSAGTQVASGTPLLHLEQLPDQDGASGDGAAVTGAVDAGEQAIDLPAVAGSGSAADLAGACLRDLRGLLLGFDGDADDRKLLRAGYLEARAELGDELVPAELDLLTVFADLSELGRNRPVRRAGAAGPDPAAAGPARFLHSPREYFHAYLGSLDADRAGVPEEVRARLRRVLAHYGVTGPDRTPELETAVFRIFLAQQQMADGAVIVSELLRQWQASAPPAEPTREQARPALEHLIEATRARFPAVSGLARGVVFRWFTQPVLRRSRARVYAAVRADLRHLDANPAAADRGDRIRAMAAGPGPLVRLLGQRIIRSTRLAGAGRPGLDHAPLLEVLTRSHYGNRPLTEVTTVGIAGHRFVTVEHAGTLAAGQTGAVTRVAATTTDIVGLPDAVAATGTLSGRAPGGGLAADIYVAWAGRPAADEIAAAVTSAVAARPAPAGVVRITVTVAGPVMQHHFTFRPGDGGRLVEDRPVRGLHPQIAERLQLGRLREFSLTRLPSVDEDLHLLRAVAKSDGRDERLIAMGQVRDLTPLRDADGRLVALPEVENTLAACCDAIRAAGSQRPGGTETGTNRIIMYVWPSSDFSAQELAPLIRRLRPSVSGAGLEEVQFVVRQRQATGEPAETSLRITADPQGAPVLHTGPPPTDAILPLDGYRQKVLSAARRGTVYPYELIGLLAGDKGTFTEYDLEPGEAAWAGTRRRRLVPAARPKGNNTAGIVAGIVTTPTAVHPEGVTRVALLGDPTKSLGSLSEPECARVIAALDLAEEMRVPIEWFAMSAGAKISMTSGSENMDWVAAALKRIVEFTQEGGEINIVIAGITVGGQPYWNAEATMLMHTKGILVMTPDSAMVLTGKQSLDFSGGVSAEDNFGIGGHDRIMGPNGQAQYWAPNLTAAAALLMTHYDHAYIAPGERAPRRAPTTDPADRDIRAYPHPADNSDFATIGEIFSDASNPDRKKPFDIRTMMRAVADQDHPVLERWAGMADAETSVVQDARIGGHPACLLGVESHAVPRRGLPPTDGPDTYTAGTLFPMSSKKTARAINAASGNRPLVVLANMSGFDGSPESMRKLQLEYGAEIGRAVVNFDGPIVFCIVSRCHGGTFAVFSKALNPSMTILAVEGSFASVLGGAPAAAVVFSGEVRKRTAADPRVAALREEAAAADTAGRAALNVELAEVTAAVRAEKLSEVAAEFDGIHTIQRAVEVGSVDRIISAAHLRPAIIDAIETGLRRKTAPRVTSGTGTPNQPATPPGPMLPAHDSPGGRNITVC